MKKIKILVLGIVNKIKREQIGPLEVTIIYNCKQKYKHEDITIMK